MNAPSELLRTPLRGYDREPAVVADIVRLAAATPRELATILEITDHREAGYVSSESLVHLLRMFVREDSEEAAWRVADALMIRVNRLFRRKLAGWRTLGASHCEEIAEALAVRFYTEWRSEAPEHEYWEIRFQVILNRQILDAIRQELKRVHKEYTAQPRFPDEAGEPLDDLPAAPALDGPMAALVLEALSLLNDVQREAFFLYHYQEWTQEEIARYQRVDVRTVRNRLNAAEKKLDEWRKEQEA